VPLLCNYLHSSW